MDQAEVFKYLGNMLIQDTDDARTVRAEILKAHKCWA